MPREVAGRFGKLEVDELTVRHFRVIESQESR